MSLVVISGGQTGVDQAALFAARDDLGIPTGGWAPRGWRTEAGPAPWLATYGLREHAEWAYHGRTGQNVRDAGATLILGSASPGCSLTRRFCKQHRRPYRWIPPERDPVSGALRFPDVEGSLSLLQGIQVLNVAGNREETHPGIGKAARDFLGILLREHLQDHGPMLLKVPLPADPDAEDAGGAFIERLKEDFHEAVTRGKCALFHLYAAECSVRDATLTLKMDVHHGFNVAIPLRGFVVGQLKLDDCDLPETCVDVPAEIRHVGLGDRTHTMNVSIRLPPEVQRRVAAKPHALLRGGVWAYRETPIGPSEQGGATIWFGHIDAWIPVLPSGDADVRP